MRFRSTKTAEQSATVYKLLSVLLQYPDQRVVEAQDEIASAIKELPTSRQSEAIRRFWSHWYAATPTQRAQTYVETFDFEKRCGLYLSYYLEGDKRQRGAILIRLKQLYAAAGLVLDGNELPDYLPLVLEFASMAPEGYGATMLADLRPALEVVRAGLREIDSPYRHLLDALCHGLPRLTPLEAERVQRIIGEGPPTEQVGLEPYAPPEVMPMEARR